MLNLMDHQLPAELSEAFGLQLSGWQTNGFVGDIWAKQANVWTNEDESKWLGWLDIVDEELGDLQKFRDLQKDIDEAGFTDILLMGMGGSSLCPEVLAITFGKKNFHVL